MTFNNK